VSSPNKSDKKAFFAGLHGAVTGIAALATASVAIIGLSINQGWIGGTKSGGGASVTTTAAGRPQYSVDRRRWRSSCSARPPCRLMSATSGRCP
jgi:hypothetical protein